MERTSTVQLNPGIKSAVLDISAITFIYFVPAISHLFSFPVYLIEPMRLMLILAAVHTHRKNAYLLALTLPLFSWLVSAHPHILKMGLITGELLLNLFLFFALITLVKNRFAAMMLAIIGSKLAYYAAKFSFIQFGLFEGQQSIISTPIYIQILVTIVLSGYIYFFYKETKE